MSLFNMIDESLGGVRRFNTTDKRRGRPITEKRRNFLQEKG